MSLIRERDRARGRKIKPWERRAAARARSGRRARIEVVPVEVRVAERVHEIPGEDR
jgi:hypothetical protein